MSAYPNQPTYTYTAQEAGRADHRRVQWAPASWVVDVGGEAAPQTHSPSHSHSNSSSSSLGSSSSTQESDLPQTPPQEDSSDDDESKSSDESPPSPPEDVSGDPTPYISPIPLPSSPRGYHPQPIPITVLRSPSPLATPSAGDVPLQPEDEVKVHNFLASFAPLPLWVPLGPSPTVPSSVESQPATEPPRAELTLKLDKDLRFVVKSRESRAAVSFGVSVQEVVQGLYDHFRTAVSMEDIIKWDWETQKRVRTKEEKLVGHLFEGKVLTGCSWREGVLVVNMMESAPAGLAVAGPSGQ
ncbi:hypothetical protein OF83DRAFT_717533 [Amylostereum chailletii]|nr:hypothetical protein OF83DRAFT_717533 [Amylostereum chailletii]